MTKNFYDLEQQTLDELDASIKNVQNNLGYNSIQNNINIQESNSSEKAKSFSRTLTPKNGINNGMGYYDEPIEEPVIRNNANGYGESNNGSFGYADSLILPAIITLILLIAIIAYFMFQYFA